MEYLNIAAIKECTEAEGPGRRFAIWTQGCLKRCRNCCNPTMQPIEKRYIVTTSDLIKLIKDAKEIYDIEGISLIGGEPFLQAKGLIRIAKWCQENNLSVVAFTGYELSEIEADILPEGKILLSYIDMLIDGAYDEELYDEERTWVGSKNQQVHFLTSRYTKGVEYEQKEKALEVCISDKELILNGWPFFLK